MRHGRCAGAWVYVDGCPARAGTASRRVPALVISFERETTNIYSPYKPPHLCGSCMAKRPTSYRKKMLRHMCVRTGVAVGAA